MLSSRLALAVLSLTLGACSDQSFTEISEPAPAGDGSEFGLEIDPNPLNFGTLAVGCDDGVVEPLIEASMPPVVADAPASNDVEAVKDEWSRIPGRVTVKYNVRAGV